MDSMSDLKERILKDLTPIRKFALLLLRAKDNEPIRGQLWYQKELFLLAKAFKELNEEADFEPYLLGPHSELADDELDELTQLGLAEKVGSKYQLTSEGEEIVNTIDKKIDVKEKEMAEEVKDFLNDLSEDELLTFVYVTYPDMTEESIKKKVTEKREEVAYHLYKKGKISIGKAAELAGFGLEKFSDFLKKKGTKMEISL